MANGPLVVRVMGATGYALDPTDAAIMGRAAATSEIHGDVLASG